jgi:hypothetical protein
LNRKSAQLDYGQRAQTMNIVGVQEALVPDVEVDRPAARRRRALTYGGAVVLVGGLIAAAYFFRPVPGWDQKAAVTEAVAAPREPTSMTGGVELPPPNPQQAWTNELPADVTEAFALAFKGDNPAQVRIGNSDFLFSPARIAQIPGLISIGDRRILVSIGWAPEASHAVPGYVTIHYFSEGAPLRLTGGWRFPSGGFGKPGELVLDKGSLPVPTVKVVGGWMGQGCFDSASTFVEMRPDRPVIGTVVEGSQMIDGAHPYNLESTVTPADGGFDIQYRGADTRKLRYRRANGRFVTRDSTAGLPACVEYRDLVEKLQ